MEANGARDAVVDVSDEELGVRLEAVWVGVWITVIVSVGCAVYALATWDQPNRARSWPSPRSAC